MIAHMHEQEHPQRSLIESNLRLVDCVVNKYSRTNAGPLGREDLLQEGRIGLINAAETFDDTVGYKFSTWAFIHIQCAIFKAFSNSARLVRIPAYATLAISHLEKESLESQPHSPTFM